MKKLLVGAVSVAVLGAIPAIAAERNLPLDPLADFPIAYTPPPVRVMTWTGCYLGFHFGGAGSNQKFDGQPFVTGIPAAAANGSLGGTLPAGVGTTMAISGSSIDVGSIGMLGGGQVGCNYQFTRSWVVGAEVDAAGASLSGGTTQTASITLIPLPSSTPPISINSSGSLASKTDFIATATGRIGFSPFSQFMFYAKGGAAWVQNSSYNFSGQVTTTPATLNTLFNFSAPSESRVGWTVGVGAEWMIDRHWSVKGEYNYLGFGTRNVTFVGPTGNSTFSVNQSVSEVKLGINYYY